MSFQIVQLIGLPPENLSGVLSQELNQESLVQSIQNETLEEAESVLPKVLPDLIVMFIDSLTGDTQGFCQQVRAQITEHRPILVVSSVSADKDQRIEYFLSGADDYLTSDTEPEEFAVRLLVHLRRNVELLSNSQTRLPSLPLFSRLIQRQINLDLPWSFLLIELNHFSVYNEVYGRIPSEQILKTLAALLKSVILPPDIVGQMDAENFMILTSPEKAEMIADHLCKQFDQVVTTFYSEKDQQRGYIISIVNEQISQRVPFVSLSTGIVSSESRRFKSHMAVFSHAVEMKLLAKANYGSNWASERMKLTGSVVSDIERPRKILIVEGDAALAFLLKSTLEMQGYPVETSLSYSDAKAFLESEPFSLLLIDPSIHAEAKGYDLCHWVKSQPSLYHLHIICMSSLHDREDALSAGADLYLPKPFELSSLFTWVDKFQKQ